MRLSFSSISLLVGLAVTAAGLSAQVPLFAPPATYLSNGTSLTGPSTYFRTAADFNGDGRLDLAAPDNRVADNILGFVIVLSTPGGGFSAPISFPVGQYVNNLSAADFNNDGRVDLLLAGPAGASIVFGNGNGTFSVPRFVPIGVSPLAGGNCVAADLNQDGNQDILVPGSGGLGVALGNGDGTFRPPALYRTTFDSVYVMTGDFNNDGKLDAIANVNSSVSASVFLGNGDGSLQAPLTTIAIPFGAQTGDFNNDGKLDIVMQTAQPRQDGSNFAISIALGTGTGGFLLYSNYVFQQPFSGLVVSDFNYDGKLDIASYMTGNGQLQILGGRGDGSLQSVIFQSPVSNGPFMLLDADMDGNGSKDLVVSSYAQFTIFRSTRGNPPLPALLTLNPASVIGGAANTTGTVMLGGPAPAGGVTLALASSDPASAFLPGGPTVTIPAGATSASFPIATRTVASATGVDITATAAGVVQTARLDLVASYSLVSFTADPAGQYGIFAGNGVVTLSGPAASSTVVSLVSANPALASVPPTVTIPAGSASFAFPITLRSVVADTPVTLTASFGGVTKAAAITILKPLDVVTISKALYTAKSIQLSIEANSTSATSTIGAYNSANGALIGMLSNAGNGKYKGTFTVNLGAAPSITLKSSLGGYAATAVSVK
jgi:hypothetical protein